MEGNEGNKCIYNVRLDTYGCGCQHNCKYCYAKSLLNFRGLWHEENPSVSDIHKLRRKIAKITPGTIVRLGGMTDCFQPFELQNRVTYETIKALNEHRIGYLIVTKSDLVAQPEYIEIMDRDLAHIQISVTCLDDRHSLTYEQASVPSQRIKAILSLQKHGFDVSIRLSPIIEQFMDFDKLNALKINRCVVEFLRVNTFIRRCFNELDFSAYTLRQSNYWHLPLEEKIRILGKINLPTKTICEDVTEHYEYWQSNVNPNPYDCCNLKQIGEN